MVHHTKCDSTCPEGILSPHLSMLCRPERSESERGICFDKHVRTKGAMSAHGFIKVPCNLACWRDFVRAVQGFENMRLSR